MARRRGPKGKKKNVSFDFCSLKTTNKQKNLFTQHFFVVVVSFIVALVLYYIRFRFAPCNKFGYYLRDVFEF